MTPTGQVFVPTVTNEPDGDFEKENALTLSTHWKEEWHTQLDLSLITLQPGSVNFAPRKSDLSSKTFVLAELFFFLRVVGFVRPTLLRSPNSTTWSKIQKRIYYEKEATNQKGRRPRHSALGRR